MIRSLAQSKKQTTANPKRLRASKNRPLPSPSPRTHRASRFPLPPALAAKLARVKLFLCDVDGVLTTGTVVMGQGAEYKEFHIQDGLGLRLLQREGIKVGWISNRPSPATQQRAADLKVDFLHQNMGSKVAAVETILAQTGVTWDEVCFIGDDVVDLGVLKRAGIAVAVANGIMEVKAAAHYVTAAEGGRGAVREVVRMILAAQGKWERMVQEFSA
jgi:3-deoxy-D-manno-octulosonate 8-phosphate phosphatase (KDO 8-P phosphatase)